MTGKPLPFSYRSRSNSRDHRNNSRHRSSNKFPQSNSKPYYEYSYFKSLSRNGSPYPRSNFQSNTQHNSRTQSPHYNRDGNRGNRLQNVRNYIYSFLHQEQSDNTTSNTENTETENTSDETLLEQQLNELLLELNNDTQDEYFICQEECYTLTEEYILSTPCKNNIWVLPLTLYTQQTPYYKKTFSPPHLEIDFLLDSGKTLNILNTDTWNEIKEYHKLQLKPSAFVLAAAKNSKLHSYGTIKLYTLGTIKHYTRI